MFVLMLVCNLLTAGSAEDAKDLNTTELIKLAVDISQIVPIKPRRSDVEFYLLEKIEEEPSLINSTSYVPMNLEKPMKIVIHGYLENHNRSWYKNIANAYLQYSDVNFIEVDWGKLARQPYIYSVFSSSFVGQEIAIFIQDLKISPENIHLIGHSLGSHIAGFAGKKIFKSTGQKIARISALDPAGPYFRHFSISAEERLDKNDAEIVDIIHTDAGFYGYDNPIGTLDIYVNKGKRIQPGCLDLSDNQTLGSVMEATFCSHARSIKYFVEWISNKHFDCSFCNMSSDYNILLKRCSLSENSVMLSSNIDKDLTGICFANTNRYQPYLY